MNDAATESSAQNDIDEDGDDIDDVDDEMKETEKPRKKKAKKSEEQVSGHFPDTGGMHLLIRRATLYWNCSASAADIADALFHQERLLRVLAAIQDTNMQGLRDTASTIVRGEFMRKKFAEAAAAADKVNTFSPLAAARNFSFPALPSCLFQC